MTSRDALDWLKKQNRRQNNGNGDLWLEMYINAFEKDLEILEIIKDNFGAYRNLYHGGKWQLTLKQKTAFVEGSKEYELLSEWWLKNDN